MVGLNYFIFMIRLAFRPFSTRSLVTVTYNEMVRAGKIRQDLNQLAVTKILDDWTDKLYAA